MIPVFYYLVGTVNQALCIIGYHLKKGRIKKDIMLVSGHLYRILCFVDAFDAPVLELAE